MMRSTVNSLLFFFIAQLVTCSVWAQQQHCDTLVLHYAFNGYVLRPEDAGRLDRFLHNPAAKPDSLLIIGYTDTVGTEAYNRRLSFSRAQMAARYVKNHTAARCSVSAKGEEEPIAGDDSLSRRVLVIARYSSRAPGPARLLSPAGDLTLSPSVRHPVVPPSPDQQPDTIISLSKINFIEDTPNLTEASRMVLPAYIQSLKQYMADFMEIDGYCNSPTPITSPGDPLFKLSVKRAKLVFDYLVDDGFDSTRLSYKGMGNASPRNSNPTTSDEARANMRVEIRIYRKAPGK